MPLIKKNLVFRVFFNYNGEKSQLHRHKFHKKKDRVIINTPPPDEMIVPPLRHQSQGGTGRIVMSPEQVPQHYHKSGVPGRRGWSPRE
jgi:hypothetical protein